MDEDNHEKSQITDLPFEIILNILKFLNICTQLKFIFTCKTYANMIYSNNDNITEIHYRGIVFDRKLTHYFVCNNLDTFKNITQAVLTFECTDLNPCQEFDLSNLIYLALNSKKLISLEKWRLPKLEKLDIVNCNYCVLDGCCFPELIYLYIGHLRKLPLRFSVISINVIIITVHSKIISKMSLKIYITLERFAARNAQGLEILDNMIMRENIDCPICHTPVIIGQSFLCISCHTITYNYSDELYTHPLCYKCGCSLFVYMNENGYAYGFCYRCIYMQILGRKRAYAAKKIDGITSYPAK